MILTLYIPIDLHFDLKLLECLFSYGMHKSEHKEKPH